MKLKTAFIENPNIGMITEGLRSIDAMWGLYLEYSIEDKDTILDLCLEYGNDTHYDEFKQAFDLYFNGSIMYDWLINPFNIRAELINRLTYRKQSARRQVITNAIDKALPELVDKKLNARFEVAHAMSEQKRLEEELQMLQQKVEDTNLLCNIVKLTFEANRDYTDDAELLECATSAN